MSKKDKTWLDKKNKLYIVIAYRWGNMDNSSHLVGIFNKKDRALKEAANKEKESGFKYSCLIQEVPLNTPCNARNIHYKNHNFRLIKEPKRIQYYDKCL